MPAFFIGGRRQRINGGHASADFGHGPQTAFSRK
jgi:hypothetical protein